MEISQWNKLRVSALAILFFLSSFGLSFSQEAKKQGPKEPPAAYVGELFDTPVPEQNYNFVRATVIIFGNKWGAKPSTPQEEEDLIWDELVYSFESFRRNIAVTQEEVEQEVSKILAGYKLDFDRKANPDVYKKWVKEKTGVPQDFFENQIRHLLQIDKLRQQVMDGIQPQVGEQEAHQLFLDEHNSLSVELAEFGTQKEAQDFYEKVRRNGKLWEEEKTKNPNIFKRPGFVSLIFLMDIWKFPRDAVYKMVKMKKASVYPPAPIYKGYGVFFVLEARPANEAEYAKEKNNYYEKIKGRKKYEGLNEWFKHLKQEAGIKIYPAPIKAQP